MSPQSHRKMAYSDLVVTPDDGKRYELVVGELCVTPSPTTAHQRVSGRLYLLLVDYFARRAIGEVFYAPTDLILTEHDVLVPDLLVVSDPGHVTERGIEGPPLLVVEIVSRSTEKQDRVVKARRYAELGVEHYWIVDPRARRVECHRLAGGRFEPIAQATGDTTLVHPDWDGLELDLPSLFGQPRG